MAALGWTKPGPQLGQVLSAVMEWQLVNPQGTAAEAQVMVKQRFGS
jgi:hypothetical protein